MSLALHEDEEDDDDDEEEEEEEEEEYDDDEDENAAAAGSFKAANALTNCGNRMDEPPAPKPMAIISFSIASTGKSRLSFSILES